MNMLRDEAKELIISTVSPKIAETVTLENALGRVLAQEISARFNIPEADKSAIDGYTYAFDSVKEYPATLQIVDESRAGKAATRKVGPNEAVFTMTGAIVPDGADTAVRIEDVKVEGDRVTISKAPRKGDLINPAGDEVKKGEPVLKPGTVLDYKNIALLSNLGYYRIEVFSRPRIGIIVTGDEVREPWEDSDRAGVRNSNLYILKDMLAPYADVHYYGIMQDEPKTMIPKFSEALKENDILLSSGGASKGKYDFTKDIAKAVDLNVHFTSTNIRPGRPLIFGTKRESLFFGLPGYPAALLVNVLTFLLPAVRKMAGMKEYELPIFSAVAKENLRAKKGRVDFVRVNIESRNGSIYVRNSGSQQTSKPGTK